LIRRMEHAPETEEVKHRATEAKQAAPSKQTERAGASASSITIVDASTGGTISPDHPDAVRALKEVLGTADLKFVNPLLAQITRSGVDREEFNFVLGVIQGIKPNDHLEAMQAAQMAVVHIATMKFARKLDRAENLDQQDSAERAFNKLARTFAVQMETLKRYRTGGEQKVTVQHVSVGAGGQAAVVGNVTHAPRETPSNRPADKAPALSDASQSAMPVIEKSERVPIPLRRGQEDDR
jgi:hypothetical protein